MNKEQRITSVVENIISCAETITQLLFQNEEISDASYFEGIIFNSLKTLEKLESLIPNDFSLINEQYNRDLFIYSLTEGYSSILPTAPGDSIDFLHFINERKEQYSIDLNNQQNFQKLLSVIAFNLYENPFQRGSNGSDNLVLIMELSFKLKNIFELHNKSVDLIIKNIELS